jgi:hypothetical protein
VEHAEEILRQLKEIEHASITTDGDEITEVHVVARTARRPKQIVRDVESALNAAVKRRIDHRVISVVIVEGEIPARTAPVKRVEPDVSAARPAARRPPPPPVRSPGVEPASAPAAKTPGSPALARIRFVSANLFVSGLRTQAQVELSWRGVTRMGSATGPSTRDNAERLVASAAINALQPYLGEANALALQEVALVNLGRQEVVVVTAKLLEQRREKTLTGSCTVEHDIQQSVVYATLAAVNRILGGVAVREPVEYELRPAST